MEEKRKKFFPQDILNIPKKNIQKTGRSSFRTRIISDSNHDTPASECISIRDQFDKYIEENYNITDEDKNNIWGIIGEQMLHNKICNLENLIDDHLKSINISKIIIID